MYYCLVARLLGGVSLITGISGIRTGLEWNDAMERYGIEK